MLDFLLIIGSSLLGIICPLAINQIFLSKKDKKYQEYKGVKSELDKLVIERSIALEAIDKINQSFSTQKIDENEKNNLLSKYNNLLNHYNEEISKIKPMVEIKEIYEYRNQIYAFISDYISKIDKKLAEFPNQSDYSNINNNHKVETLDARLKDKFIRQIRAKEEIKECVEVTQSSLDNDYKKESEIGNNKEIYPSTPKHLEDENYSPQQEEMIDNSPRETGSDEINNIQKDILNILQKLEKPSFKI
jgi:hypothetical protein